MSLPSAPNPATQVLPSVLSFFKAVPASLPPKPSHHAEHVHQADTHDASLEPPVIQARSKYFSTAAGGSGGTAGAALPFSARGGACGSMFKNVNRGSADAAATEQPLIIKSSPRDGERVLQS